MFVILSRQVLSRFVVPSSRDFNLRSSTSNRNRNLCARIPAVVISASEGRQTPSPSPVSMGTNADLGRMATVDTSAMSWTPSPNPSVWRKRVFHTGGTESGRVTSVVKFGEGSSFALHPHPEGEEIFVLEGTFSDVRGDHKPGTLLLNPEGFEHAPSSADGCVILVRLRQYPGDRPQMALDSTTLEWKPFKHSGPGSVKEKLLLRDDRFQDTIQLQQWAPGTEITLSEPKGLEVFVLSGQCESVSCPELKLSKQSWIRLPPGDSHKFKCDEQCEVYLKANALPLAEPISDAA